MKLFVRAASTLLLALVYNFGAAQAQNPAVGTSPLTGGEKEVKSSVLTSLVGARFYDQYGELVVLDQQSGLWTYRPQSVGPNQSCRVDKHPSTFGEAGESKFTIVVPRGQPCGPLHATFEVSNGGKTITMLGFNRTLTRQ